MNNNKNAINVGVQVDRDLVIRKLKEVGPKLVRRSWRKALKAVGDFWVPAMKAKVPVLLGDLQNAITAKVTTRMTLDKKAGQKLPEGKVEVGPRLDAPRTDGRKSVGPGIYGMWVEFGLKKKIYPMQPFARPVFDSTADRAVQIFADVLSEGLKEEANLTSVKKDAPAVR